MVARAGAAGSIGRRPKNSGPAFTGAGSFGRQDAAGGWSHMDPITRRARWRMPL